jgi:hypothetical protein
MELLWEHFVDCRRTAAVVGMLALVLPAILSASSVTAPTYSKNVAPILRQHCVSCHRPGEIASGVSLLTYDLTRPWAKAIKEKVLTREMPPWGADPNASVKFRNDARLASQDIRTLVAWIDAGAPEGSHAEPPPMPTSAHDWQHPRGLPPDLVISLPGEFRVPGQGQIPYVRYLAKVPFSGDKWIAALQARPGNRAVVHHMAITEVAVEEGMKPADLDAAVVIARQLGLSNRSTFARPAITAPGNPEAFDMLGVYTPGTTLEMYASDSGKLLKGGENMYINFNIHYQPTGRPENDRSTIAFWFREEPPTHQLFRVPGATRTIIANGTELVSDAPGRKAEGTGAAIPPIPPYAGNYELIGITAHREPITIYQFQPHAHVRCHDFKYTVVYPDGREQTVLSVPKYNFQWQQAYDLETPLHLPAGSKLVVTAHYDNSRKNTHNPAPDKAVYFRDAENQSWDEMFTPFIQYSIDTQDSTRLPEPSETAEQPRQPRPRMLDIVEVEGCLDQTGGAWILNNATDPVMSESPATSPVALKTAEVRTPGTGRYQLLGVGSFNPSKHNQQEVRVKGVLIKNSKESRLNVTSLQTAATSCF